MKRLLSGVLAASFALLVLPAMVLGAAKPTEPVAMVGEKISPRSFSFSSLPAKAPDVLAISPKRKPEGLDPSAEAMLEEAKKHPPVITPAMLPHFTTDGNLGPSAMGAKSDFGPFAPVVNNGFDGISQGPYIPSEPTVAAGPLNIFTAGNVSVTVTNKDGSNKVETDGATFFGVPSSEGAISDAQCYYDAIRGRFVALCFTYGTAPNLSNFYLAISKTNDARGAWWLYKFDMTKDGTTQTANWSDYQSLGVSDDKIAMTGQQFSFAADAYQYQKVRIIDRAAAYAGGTLTYVDFANFAIPAGGDTYDNFVTKAARNLSAGDNTIHLLCVRIGSGTRVTYRTITGPPNAPVLSTGNFVTVSSYSAPPDAVQKGSATLVPTNDCRPTDFYVRNGQLVAAWHTALTLGGAVSGIKLFKMRTSDRTVLIDETYGVSGTFLYYPAVTMDSVGTIFLGYDRSSSTEYPSAYATGRRRSDASLQSSALLKAGVSATAQTRWGDYTGIDNDATLSGPGGAVAWYTGQYTKGTNVFGVWANKLTFTYGQVAGTVSLDCDGNAATTGDRSVLAGATVTLKQGATTIATTTTDVLGAYNFGYLETGVYDAIVTVPAGGTAVDAVVGTGGNTQTRVSASDIQIDLTNAQTSTGNAFYVAQLHGTPVTTSISPNFKNVGDVTFTLTVNGSNFIPCSVVRLDGLDRTTTYISASQLTAVIPSTDLLAGGTRSITVFNPTPGGGTSNAQTLIVSGTPDTTPPVATLTSPAGGENWVLGSTHNITWTATDDVTVSSIDLAYSTNGGATFPNVIASGITNSGTYSWTTPSVPSTTMRVRVVAHDGGGNIASDSSHTNFTLSGWTVAASAGAGGSISPSGTVGVADGATPSFAITPNAGYHVADVLVNGVSVGAVTNYTFAAIHANQTIAASFAITEFTLNVTIVGGGSVTKDPSQATYLPGTQVALTPVPNAGWNFSAWSGDASGSANPLTVTVNANTNITATFTQRVYTWALTAGSGAFGTAANWTPNRTTPAADDVLQFTLGGTSTATGVSTQTIGQLTVSNNTSITLQAAATTTLSVAGLAGTDVSVAAGSTLGISGASGLSMNLATGANMSVSGSFSAAGGAHRLQSVDAGSVVFTSGAVCTHGTGATGNLFGTGTGTSGLNSIVFQAGSRFSQVAGSTPFGASTPSSVVVFQAGSRFRLDGAVTPSLSGRTYADFEANTAGTTSPTGAAAFSMDSLIVSQGTFNLNLTGGGAIRGDIRVKSGATLTVSPASGTPVVTLNGATPQTVNIFGTFTTTAIPTININNPAGVTLGTNLTVSGPLTFTSGRVTTGANTLAVAATGSLTGAGASSGWVVGNLRRNVAIGASSRTYDVGSASAYTPIAISVTGAAAAFDLTGSTTSGDHPNIGTSGLNASKSVNRYWTLTPSGSPTFTSYDAVLNFVAGDIDAGVNTANLLPALYGGSWTLPTAGTRTATSTQATGVTAFGDFMAAETPSWTITASAGANGTITPVGAVTVANGASQGFTIVANSGYVISDVLVDAVSVGAVGAYTFTNVTADHTIAASFVAIGRTLTTGVTGSGSITKSPDLGTYPNGSTVGLTAVPSSGWAFTTWSGDLTGSTNPQNLLMDADKTVNATFVDVAVPTVAVTAPNGGETVLLASSTSITWTAADNVGVSTVDVLLSRNGVAGPFDPLATGVANSGSYTWTVTGPATTTALVKVVAHDAAANTGEDVSDASFTISSSTGVNDGPVTAFSLGAVHPNPTRNTGSAFFAVPRSANVHVGVMDVQGREVLVLADGQYEAGRYTLAFNRNQRSLGAGLYFLRMRVSGGPTYSQRFVITK